MNKENKDRFYYNSKFLGSPDARSVRILSEYYGPLQRFERNDIQDFLVFFGSARIKSRDEAQKELKNAPKNIFCMFCRVRFAKKLGLDAGIGSWDLKNRIARRKLRI